MKAYAISITMLFMMSCFATSKMDSLNSDPVESQFSLKNYYHKIYDSNGNYYVNDLKKIVSNTITKKHIISNSQNDTLVEECPEKIEKDKKCIGHKILTYSEARKYLFGDIDLKKNDKLGYYIRDVYCQKDLSNKDRFLNRERQLGPMLIPDGKLLNCEHTWPKSRFKNNTEKESTRSIEYKFKVADLHHLFPTNSSLNAKRGRLKFGEISKDSKRLGCEGNRIGLVTVINKNGGRKFSGEQYYEPPQDHKGNVARALFYFATRYNLDIDSIEENFLRKWHTEDPVDESERERHEKIFKIQGNRNPFIDYPNLVDYIENL